MNKNILQFIAKTHNIYNVIQYVHSFIFRSFLVIFVFFTLFSLHLFIYDKSFFELINDAFITFSFHIMLIADLTHSTYKNLKNINFSKGENNEGITLFFIILKIYIIHLFIFRTYSSTLTLYYLEKISFKYKFLDVYAAFANNKSSYLTSAMKIIHQKTIKHILIKNYSLLNLY